MFSACAGVSSIASHTLAKRFLLIDLAPSTNPGNAARPGCAAALERPAGDACAIPKNRGSIPHPRWWMTQRPRPCMGAAYDHLRRASIVPRGADHRNRLVAFVSTDAAAYRAEV